MSGDFLELEEEDDGPLELGSYTDVLKRDRDLFPLPPLLEPEILTEEQQQVQLAMIHLRHVEYYADCLTQVIEEDQPRCREDMSDHAKKVIDAMRYFI